MELKVQIRWMKKEKNKSSVSKAEKYLIVKRRIIKTTFNFSRRILDKD